MADGRNTDMDAVFGGGGNAAPSGPSLRDAAAEAYGEDPAEETGEEAEAVPAEFSTHALEAFPELDEAQLKALYRAIESCK